MKVYLSASVGQGGKNLDSDVGTVQVRLKDLGFYPFNVDGDAGPRTIHGIKLFQSVIAGAQKIGGDGRVDPGMNTNKWLEADNAPRWILMPKKGTGFRNIEREDCSDHHDYGTSWLANTIALAGVSYWEGRAAGSRIIVNDASLELGGKSPDHAGHQCGMQVDLRPPRKDGVETLGTRWNWPEYDQSVMRAQLQAFVRQALVTSIYFNDPVLVAERLCKRVTGHDDHIHISIKSPERR